MMIRLMGANARSMYLSNTQIISEAEEIEPIYLMRTS